MRQNILFFVGLSWLLSVISCNNSTPEIADITEISATTLHETMVCTPIGNNNELFAIIYKDFEAQLCSYNVDDNNSNYNWINSVEQYGFGGNSPIYSPIFELKRNDANALFMQQFYPTNEGGDVKSVKFNENGNFQWQMTDSIHQPDTIYFGTDIIDLLTKTFRYGGMVNFDNGGTSVVSVVDSMSIDRTYLQLTHYNNEGSFTHNHYLRFPGSWELTDVYNTSDNNLLFVYYDRGLGISNFKLIDTTGTIIFERELEIHILKTHFFYENSDGNYIISGTYIDNSNQAHGIVFCVDNGGIDIWPPFQSDIGSSGSLLLAVNEQDDGYLFSGVKTSSAFFDWRDDFDAYDYQAVLMKTDLDGNLQWQNNDLFNSSYFKSAAAGVIFSNNINLFISRDDGPVQNVSILKLDNEGKIKN